MPTHPYHYGGVCQTTHARPRRRYKRLKKIIKQLSSKNISGPIRSSVTMGVSVRIHRAGRAQMDRVGCDGIGLDCLTLTALPPDTLHPTPCTLGESVDPGPYERCGHAS